MFGKYFHIRSQMNGLVLDVDGGSTDEGARVITYTQNPTLTDNQLWFEEPITGTIRSKATDFCLDLDGDTLVVNSYSLGNSNQQWEIEDHTIHNRDNPTQVLDIAGSDSDTGARVCAFEVHGGANQLWETEHVLAMYFYIRSEMNDKVIDVRDANPAPGEKAIMYDKNDEECDNQLWYEDEHGVIRSKLNDFALDASEESVTLMPYDDENIMQQWVVSGNKIVNKLNHDEVLDIKGADGWDGAKLCSYAYNGDSNQHWRIEYV